MPAVGSPCPFRHYKVINLVLIVDPVHEIDNTLTTAQYFVILYLFLISEQTHGLQTEPVVKMKQIVIAFVLE